MTRDGGSTVFPRSQRTPADELALEWNHPSALLALSGGRPVRSADNAVASGPVDTGLPAACRAAGLARDRSVPSVFLLACADGTTWRYRSDGTDLSATDSPDGSTSVVDGTLLRPATPMVELARVEVEHVGSRADGSLAFDGTILYYADAKERGTVHRQRARDGGLLPDLQTKVPRAILMLAYDANRHHLFVVDVAARLWDVDLRTGDAVRMFASPANGRSPNSEEDDEANGASFPGSFTYDPATDRLLFARDGDSGWTEYDTEGTKTGGCHNANLPMVVRVNGTITEASVAGLVATGDGQVYVEAEDDQTVLRMDRSCHVVALFAHPYFSEAGNENDSVACDTVTFDTPAVWLRDAQAGALVAYEVPGGYCALPSLVWCRARRRCPWGDGDPCARSCARRPRGHR